MFYKVTCGNMLVDLLTELRLVIWLPRQKRFVATDSQSANCVMSSDGSTVYHLIGKPQADGVSLSTVKVEAISQAEFERLSTEFAIAKAENENLRRQVDSLTKQMSEQTLMLERILSKLE